MARLSKNHNGFGASLLLLVLVIAVVVIAAGWLVIKNNYKASKSKISSSTTAVTTTAPQAPAGMKVFSDTAKLYTVYYPKEWLAVQELFTGDATIPLLDTTQARFIPAHLPVAAIGNTWVGIFTYKTSDMAAALGVKSGFTTLKVDGYDALNYPSVVPTAKDAKGNVTTLGYTDDFYAVAHNGVTLVFSFREKGDVGGGNTFDASNFVPLYSALVNTVKFTN